MSLSHLSDEELLKLDQESAVEEQPAPVVQEAPKKNQVNDIESVGRGAINAVPFGNQIAAGASALLDNTQESFGERYNRSKAEWDTAQAAAKADDPYLFGGGEIAADVAGFALLPGAGLAANAVKLGGWTLGKSLGLHPEDSLGTHLQNSAIDTGIGLAGGALIEKGIKVAAPLAKKWATNTAIDWMTDGTHGLKKDISEHVYRMYNTGANKALSSLEANSNFIDELRSMKVSGKSLLHADSTAESVFKDSIAFKEAAAPEYSRILKTSTEKIDTTTIRDKLIADLGPLSGEAVEDAFKNKQIASIHDTFSEIKYRDIYVAGGEKISEPYTVAKSKTLEELFAIKKSYSKQVNWKNPVEKLNNEVLYTRSKSMSQAIEENIASIDEKLLPEWKTLNRQYGNADILENITAAKGDPNIGGGIISAIRKHANLSGAGAGFLAVSAGMNPAAAVGLGLFTKTVLASGEASSPKLAYALNKVSNHLVNLPSSKISQGVMAASGMSASYFHDHVMSAASTIELQDKPLARNNVDVKNRSDHILQIAQSINPAVANSLRNAIDNEDEQGIASAMEQISKHPSAAKIVQPGIGWNGVVTDPNDIKKLESQVNGMNISHKQKLVHKKNLFLNGTIPVLEQEAPYYLDYKARNKNNPDY